MTLDLKAHVLKSPSSWHMKEYDLRFLALALCLYSATLTSCSNFRKTFSGTAVQCGLSEQAVDSRAHYIKILLPNGGEISERDLATTRARYLTSGGSPQTLDASPKGCFLRPNQAGVLQVYSLQGLQSSRQFGADGVGLEYVSLEETGQAEAELLCPSQGYFADQSLEFPIRLGGTASQPSSRIQLLAKNLSSGIESELFLKNYGRASTSLGQNLPTSQLAEGSYELRLEALTTNNRWDESLISGNTRSLCPLAILHKSPTVAGDLSLGAATKSFYKKGESMNWTVTGPYSDLRVCKESRGNDEDNLAIDGTDSCRPKICVDNEAFQFANALRADESGVFDYFYFAENRAGLRSETACRRVIVSEQKPLLNVTWDETEWNRPLAVMSRPRPTVNAHISVAHPQRANAEIERSLSCKMDFLLDGVSALPAKDAVCMSGRCQGQRLDKWVACDTNFRASLDSFWNEQRARPSLMRLHVKADDSAGQVAEQVISVWIHPQRWENESGPSMPGDSSSVGFFRDANNTLFAKSYNSLMRWDEGSRVWNSVDLPFVDPLYVRFVRSGSGTIFAFNQSNGSELSDTRVEAYERIDSTWIPRTEGDAATPCFTGNAEPLAGGGIICTEYNRAVTYQNGQWKDVLLPLQEDGSPCHRLVVRKNGRLAVVCPDSSLHQQNAEGEWVGIPLDPDDKPNSEDAVYIDEDAEGQLWVVRGTYSRATARYFVNNTWTTTSLPSLKESNNSIEGFTRTTAGAFMYFDYFWDSGSKQWTRLKGLAESFPNTSFKSIHVGAGKIFLTAQGRLLLWDAGEILQYPLSWYGMNLEPSDINSASVFLGSGTDLWIMVPERPGYRFYKPTLIPFHKSNTFGPEVNTYSRFRESRSYTFWIEKSGDITLLVSDRGLIRSSHNGWETLWNAGSRTIARGGRVADGTFYMYSDYQDILKYREGDMKAEPWLGGGQFNINQTQGRVWIRDWLGQESWVIDSTGERKIAWPQDSRSNTPFDFANQAILLSDRISNPIYRLEESKPSWENVSSDEASLPVGAKFSSVKAVMLPGSLFFLQDGLFAVLNRGESTPKTWTMPDSENFGELTKVIQLGLNDFIIMSPSDGIYRGDGQQWKPVLIQSELTTRFKLEDRTYLYDMQIDSFHRLFVIGEYFRFLILEGL